MTADASLVMGGCLAKWRRMESGDMGAMLMSAFDPKRTLGPIPEH